MEPEVSNRREPGWENEWAEALRSTSDLVTAGLISPEEGTKLEPVLARFRFVLPRYYAELIDRSDPACPIRLQAIPSGDEMTDAQGFKADPLSDLKHRPELHLTHRYSNRALLHLTPNCSMTCRYCFRKTLLNELSPDLFAGGLEKAFLYLVKHEEIEEVILSGGDPLMARDWAIERVMSRLASIPHLKRLRIHSRVPVTFPLRITEELIAALGSTRLQLVVVTHFNHPREITRESSEACRLLLKHSQAVLNQSVLLKGVNSSAGTLSALSEGLFEMGVLPYYLHHPDRASGTSHFDLTVEEGLRIFHEMRAHLPGYLVPRYVIDVVGHPFKMSVEEYQRSFRVL